MAAGWIEASFDLEGHHIGVSVKRLPDEEAARLAASLAWFASVATTPGGDLDATEWPHLLRRIMREYVSLTVADEALEQLEELWTPLCSGALRTFIQVNEIDPLLTHHLLRAGCLAG
jgi:hypothetical protein